jgi:hypothetical protein
MYKYSCLSDTLSSKKSSDYALYTEIIYDGFAVTGQLNSRKEGVDIYAKRVAGWGEQA